MGVAETRWRAFEIFREARSCADAVEAQQLLDKGLRIASLADQQEAWLATTGDRIWLAGPNEEDECSPANT